VNVQKFIEYRQSDCLKVSAFATQYFAMSNIIFFKSSFLKLDTQYITYTYLESSPSKSKTLKSPR